MESSMHGKKYESFKVKSLTLWYSTHRHIDPSFLGTRTTGDAQQLFEGSMTPSLSSLSSSSFRACLLSRTSPRGPIFTCSLDSMVMPWWRTEVRLKSSFTYANLGVNLDRRLTAKSCCSHVSKYWQSFIICWIWTAKHTTALSLEWEEQYHLSSQEWPFHSSLEWSQSLRLWPEKCVAWLQCINIHQEHTRSYIQCTQMCSKSTPIITGTSMSTTTISGCQSPLQVRKLKPNDTRPKELVILPPAKRILSVWLMKLYLSDIFSKKTLFQHHQNNTLPTIDFNALLLTKIILGSCICVWELLQSCERIWPK